MNNKIKFHININEEINFTNDRPSKRKKRKLKTKETKRRNRQKYKANQKIKRPKGLNFVLSCKTNTHSLKFDAQNFIRKLEWKAFFAQHPELRNNDNNNIQRNLIVESNKHPDFQHTCIDSYNETPKRNLTPAEREGQKWIMEKIKDKKLFVSKADKGGAMLILDYDTVIEVIEKELFDNTKYEILKEKADAHCEKITNNIKEIVLQLNKNNIINDNYKTLITGLNKNNETLH